jgi:hypothetical protein
VPRGQLTGTHAENSDVVPLASVDVDVIVLPAARPATMTANPTLPVPSVVTDFDPRNTAPSPNPLALRAVFEKNSIVNVALAGPFNVPLIVPLATWADEMTGKLFAPQLVLINAGRGEVDSESGMPRNRIPGQGVAGHGSVS